MVRNRGPWRIIDDLKIATTKCISLISHRRLHSEIGMITPVELEDIYHHNQPVPVNADTALAGLKQPRGDSVLVADLDTDTDTDTDTILAEFSIDPARG